MDIMKPMNLVFAFGDYQDGKNKWHYKEVNAVMYLLLTRDEVITATNNSTLYNSEQCWIDFVLNIFRNKVNNVNDGIITWNEVFKPSLKDLLEDNGLGGVFQDYMYIEQFEDLYIKVVKYDSYSVQLRVQVKVIGKAY